MGDVTTIPEVTATAERPSHDNDKGCQNGSPGSGGGNCSRSDVINDPARFFEIKSWHTRKELLKSKTVCNKIHQYLLANIDDKRRPKDAIEPVYVLETILLTSQTYLRIMYKLGSLYYNKQFKDVVGKANNTRSTIPNNPSIIHHIFRNEEGHLPNTAENQALVERICNDPKCYLGTDKHGNIWFGQVQKDGRQVWGSTRNGEIRNGGVNNFAHKYNPETGLSAKSKPSQKSKHLGFFHERTINHERTSLSGNVLLPGLLFRHNKFG